MQQSSKGNSMKKEIFRVQSGMIRQGRILRGPFFLQFCKGEISGIITDDSFEKEILVDFFRCNSTLESGYFYSEGRKIAFAETNSKIKRLFSRYVSVISGKSQLFESLSLMDNIFIPGYLFKQKRQKKIAIRLMEFFDIEIPLNTKIKELSFLQRLQIEILRAVARHHKLIIIADVNGRLHSKERNSMRKLYERLTELGYAICLIESFHNISPKGMDLIHVIEKGKSVGSYSQVEAEYADIAGLVNGAYDEETHKELIQHMNDQLYSGFKGVVMEMEEVSYKSLHKLSMKVYRGEIAEINCRTGTDYVQVKQLLTGKADFFEGNLYYKGQKRRISLLKQEISKWRIGCVDFANQDNLLFDNLSIVENVCYPLCLRNKKFF